MRCIATLLLLAAVASAQATALDVLASLADDDDSRAALGKRLDALGVDAIPVLDGMRKRVRAPRAQELVRDLLGKRGREIRARVLAGERKWFGKCVRPMLDTLSIDALWELRLGRDGTVYFDATTFKDPKRLKILEYLVAPDDRKAYETLALMPKAEWADFKLAFSAGRPLKYRWIVWGMATIELKKALPWAEPQWRDHGLFLGGNHDETKNKALPGQGVAIQVGVVIGG